MYKVDIENKQLIKLPVTKFGALDIKERFDIQEWICKSPDILGEELLIISKELRLPSGKRLDLLAIDKQAELVIIELKRDESGSDVEWQAIKYASYCSSFTHNEIYQYFAEYLGTNDEDAELKIEEFIDNEPEDLNKTQRILLVSKEFHSEVISAVLWLREAEINVVCVRLTPHLDDLGNLYINPEVIIPLPEAKDYIQKKETKQKDQKRTIRSTFSLEKSDLPDDELKLKLIQSLQRRSDLTPRFRVFLEIIIQEDRIYDREEIKQGLYESGIGESVGQSGRYLSNISQFLTKRSNPHLRQIIYFDTGGTLGEIKNDYHVLTEYRDLVNDALLETSASNEKEDQILPDDELLHP